jgi:hypothetical protein
MAQTACARVYKNGSFSETKQNTLGRHLIELEEVLRYFLSPERDVLEEGLDKISQILLFGRILRLC